MKRAITLFLTVCLLLSMLSLPVQAEDLKAREVAQAYMKVLNSSSFYAYGMKKPVCFSNLYGDDIPEMIVVTSTAAKTEAQVWTYRNGAAQKLLAMNWVPVSASKYYLYKLSDGSLAEYGTNAGMDPAYSHEFRNGCFYTPGSDGTFTQTGSFAYDYYQYADGSTQFAGGTQNGSAAAEAAVKAEERKLRTGTLIFDAQDDVSGAMTVQEARTYLNSVVGSFFDVPTGQYYTDAVEWAVSNGITTGTGTAVFSPEQSCTRGQAVTFLWRAAGEPKGSASASFTDVPSNAYYADAVKWAVANGITSGTGNGRFSPDQVCTRAQIVTLMYRAVGSPAVTSRGGFSDVASGSYYHDAVIWAAANQVTGGTGEGKFSPDSPCTRGQIVTFLYRARNIAIDPKPVKGWSEVYEDFLTNHKFLNAGQAYSFGSGSSFAGFRVYLYDLDRDGTPELSITNGESGRSTRYAYLYTCVNGQIQYLGIGPTDAFYDETNRAGVLGVFRDGGYMSITRYTKRGTALNAQTAATYDNFEGDSAALVKALRLIPQWNVDQIGTTGWSSFLETQPLNGG